ncbi:MAG: DUF2852 domain-containing protein [Acetobacteraceae bacterium]
MFLLDKIDAVGWPAWVALSVLGFWLAWPLGVAMLVFAGLSGRFRGMRCAGPGRWYNTGGPRIERHACGWRRRMQHAPSGNFAFDEYRTETLRRLEDEQRKFVEYLERLRRAKDRAEFDQFMTERRDRPEPPPTPVPDVA